MPTLLLVLALSPAPEPSRILAMCEAPATHSACRKYMAGFIHAISAYEAETSRRLVCLPDGVNLYTERERLVSVLRDFAARGEKPGPRLTLRAFSKLFPCE
jgi:hypothetical protein